ncbi:hypothetical protein [Clostridium sp. B9]|uniref:hypothetical protein n=1 Tax=Clostridium sp. B9 TaxID=3423224 RepID=UPI003D2F31D3
MRKKLINFADITKIYNEIYFNDGYSKIQQKVVTEKVRRMALKIDNKNFKNFLAIEELNAEEELKFFKKAIKPIKNKETKFKYKTFCLIITMMIISREEHSIIEGINKDIIIKDDLDKELLKNKVYKKKNIVKNICSNNFKDSRRRRVKRKKIKRLCSEVEKNTKLSKINGKRKIRKITFREFLDKGMDISFRIIMYYIDFLRFRMRWIDIALANEFLMISGMSYSSKCILKEKINKFLEKEIYKNNKCIAINNELNKEEINKILDNRFKDIVLNRLIK